MSTFVSYVRVVGAPPQVRSRSAKGPAPPGIVTFENDVRAAAPPTGARSRAYHQLLSDLWRIHHPAYVELGDRKHAGVHTVVRVHVPLLVWVTGLASLDRGIDVTLHVSHARHVLLKTNPRYEELLDTLRAALGTSARVAVTEDPSDHKIIDVTRFDESLNPAAEPVSDALSAPAIMRSLARSARKKAKKKKLTPRELFTLVSGVTCDPVAPGQRCIPFLFLRDGCWARAHEMCRLMTAAGAAPRKIWVSGQGQLRVETANDPDCEVHWSYHVAPVIGTGRNARVIDPATCRGAVTLETWLRKMNGVGLPRLETASSAYRPHLETDFGDGENHFTRDNDFSETRRDLGTYQAQLSDLTIANGAPPFASCLT